MKVNKLDLVILVGGHGTRGTHYPTLPHATSH